ncbi:VOC family protein [Leptospira licerasiae]|uniref:VOC family protein n=1 Tax=Leptospira licerasiae TaxID=447106 RepID=UPI0010835E00|nr:VOC family protein [Leptospira licerasiae]TGM89883.1 glyoxalase [Leptospira licerasiae]
MIHHIAISTRDPETLKKFYMLIPGLSLEKDHFYQDGKLRSSWFLAGTTRIMIEKEDEPKAPHALIFSAQKKEERDKIDSLFENSFTEKTNYTKYFTDPDGNRVGFSSYPEPWD